MDAGNMNRHGALIQYNQQFAEHVQKENMGVRTKLFGPHTWKVLHALAELLDEGKCDCYPMIREFFCLVGFVLPCVYCRLSYRRFLSQPQLTVDQLGKGAHRTQRFVYSIHTSVNQKLYSQELAKAGKDPETVTAWWNQYQPSFETVRKSALKVQDPAFWHAWFHVCLYILCDYRERESVQFLRFFELFGQLLDASGEPLGRAWLHAMVQTAPLWKKEMTLSERLDLVWAWQKHMPVPTTFASHEQMMILAREGIVGCVPSSETKAV